MIFQLLKQSLYLFKKLLLSAWLAWIFFFTIIALSFALQIASTQPIFKTLSISENILTLTQEGLRLLKIFIGLWIIGRMTSVFYDVLQMRIHKKNETLAVALKDVERSLKFVFYLGLVLVVLPALNFSDTVNFYFVKMLSVLFVLGMTQLLFDSINAGEKAMLKQYREKLEENLDARQMLTKTRFFKRLIKAAILIFAISTILMFFESMRKLGVSLLASAGLITAIVGFAAQRVIYTFVAGLQLVFSHTVKIGDIISIDNQTGTVEDISFSNVTLRKYDQQILVIPAQFFLEKTFQNWSRISTDLIAPIDLYIPKNISLETMRQEFQRVLSDSSFWDKKNSDMKVVNTSADHFQIHFTASAKNTRCAWELSCEVRESLIHFLQRQTS